MVRGRRIDNLHPVEIHTVFLGPSPDLGRIAEQDRMPDLFFDQHVAGTQDFFVIAFGKDYLLGIGLRLVDHGARNFVGLSQSTLKLRTIGLEIDRLLGDSADHGGFGDGGRFPHQNARIERLGNEILAAKLQARHAVRSANGIGNILLGKIGQRVGGGQLHCLVDGRGADVERSAENEGKSEHVVDLVGIVGASGGDDDIVAGSLGIFVADLRIGIRQGKYDRIAGHGANHVLIDCVFYREPGENVSTGHGF